MTYTNTGRKAQLDSLTGTRGRDQFNDDLDRLVRDGRTASVALFDIDYFLMVNENEGHKVGDEVLQHVAHTVMEQLNENSGQVYRIGGDEFAALMGEVEKEQAFLALETARGQIAAADALSEKTSAPTISVGVATYPDDGATRQEIMRKADDALHRAKSGRKNMVVLAREERKIPKTNHYTQGQLERLTATSEKQGVGEAELLREALDDLLKKYSS